MNSMDAIPYLSDKDLLCNLLDVPFDAVEGGSISEIIDSLLTHSVKSEQVMMVREIAQRYGTKYLQSGESFNRSSQIFDHYYHKIGSEKQEHFYVVLLDNKNRVITEKLISLGTLNRSIVHPRDVFAPAIEQRAASIVLVHNHPSGDPSPSNQDIEITKRLAEVGEMVGIRILDHIVIGDERYFSFVDEEMIP